MPAVKAHIANSADPLVENMHIEAVCGVVVLQARFLMMWDAKRISPQLDEAEWRGVCRKCVAKELPESRVYLILNGQELKHSEI